nr:hypothetical protein [uncultured Flavobacterium sp.]
MRIKFFFLLFNLVYIVNVYGQTGINTLSATPQQALHVNGTSVSSQIGTSGVYLVKPTIRVEGLNNTNNAVASGSTSLVQHVSTTQDGDFILTNDYVTPLVVTNLGTDEITNAVTINVNTSGLITGVLKTYSFTLNQPSAVHFIAAFSVSVDVSSGAVLTDNINRAYRSWFNFTIAPPGVAISAPFGHNGYSYTNVNTTGAKGNMFLQPEAYLVLPKGSYTVQLIGGAVGSGTEIYPFRAIFGQDTADKVSIIATAL